MTTPALSGDALTGLPTVEISLPGLPGFEKVAREAAALVARHMGFSPDRVEDLKTAVAEACLNAVEHGNGGDTGSRVQVILRAAATRLEVSVNDRGVTPLPDPLPPPGLPNRTRGWGLFFIVGLMDEVAFQRLPEGGNRVCMVIHLQQPSVLFPSPAAEIGPVVAGSGPVEAPPSTSAESANGVSLETLAPETTQDGPANADTPSAIVPA